MVSVFAEFDAAFGMAIAQLMNLDETTRQLARHSMRGGARTWRVPLWVSMAVNATKFALILPVIQNFLNRLRPGERPGRLGGYLSTPFFLAVQVAM
ncbi:hypothetical protein ACVCNR_21450 (plasmid) [Aquamicrobium terrae]